jgi:hypothetical protein
MDRPQNLYGSDDQWGREGFIKRIEGLDVSDEVACAVLAMELTMKRSYSCQHSMFTMLTANMRLERLDPAPISVEGLDIYIDKDRIAAEWNDVVTFHAAVELIFLVKSLKEKGLPLAEDSINNNEELFEAAHQKAMAYEYRKVAATGDMDEYQDWVREFYGLTIDGEKDSEKKSAYAKRLREREEVYEKTKAGAK